ncbi:hypothetical protein [uncultured Lacinutrix sp.]|nr:hypothetical protein [uncultured Lacinutrix sp.]
MKAIINILRKSNRITDDSLFVRREVLRFSNTKEALWNGAKRYAH